MAKGKTAYSCTACGNESNTWLGRCPICDSWGSLVEVELNGTAGLDEANLISPYKFSEIMDSTKDLDRVLFDMPETERVFGGGMVKGSTTLLVGEPGIGKSTLLLHLAEGLSGRNDGKICYIAGEESPVQIGIRGKRIGIKGKHLEILPETNVDLIIAELNKNQQSMVIIDSIQTLFDSSLDSVAGTIGQIRACASKLISWSKVSTVPLLMSGHLTKEGSVAGPKVLEHSVDVVLQLEGNSSGSFRSLHGLKNRFGSTNEMAVFEMRENGLIEILDPSSDLIAERPEGVPGSVVVPVIEGTRPLLVEIQSLVSRTGNSFEPRRTATGIELNRLVLISSVLSKRSLIDLKGKDIIVNVVGGIRVSETAADLGIALAIASSALDKEFPSNMAAVGELGLTGEIRRTTYIERRIIELARLGFERVLVPASFVQSGSLTEVNIKLIGVNNIQDAIKKIQN